MSAREIIEWPMFNSARCGTVSDACDVGVVDAVPGIDLQAEVRARDRRRSAAAAILPSCAAAVRIRKRAGVQFDHLRAERFAASICIGRGLDEEAHANARALQALQSSARVA